MVHWLLYGEHQVCSANQSKDVTWKSGDQVRFTASDASNFHMVPYSRTHLVSAAECKVEFIESRCRCSATASSAVQEGS